MTFEIAITIVILTSIIVGYLSGSVLYSVIIGKVFYKKDLRNFESKNAGATNSLRIYGKKAALVILLLDILKSLLPTLILWLIFKNTIDQYMVITNGFNPYSLIGLTGLCAVIGHCWPVFFKFKGGKGASCFGGFVLCMNPFIGLFCLVFFLSLSKFTKYVSLSSIISAWLPAVLVFIPGLNYSFILSQSIDLVLIIDLGINWILFIFGLYVVAGTLLTLKHRKNIVRLLKGTERKLGTKTEAKAQTA